MTWVSRCVIRVSRWVAKSRMGVCRPNQSLFQLTKLTYVTSYIDSRWSWDLGQTFLFFGSYNKLSVWGSMCVTVPGRPTVTLHDRGVALAGRVPDGGLQAESALAPIDEIGVRYKLRRLTMVRVLGVDFPISVVHWCHICRAQAVRTWTKRQALYCTFLILRPFHFTSPEPVGRD